MTDEKESPSLFSEIRQLESRIRNNSIRKKLASEKKNEEKIEE